MGFEAVASAAQITQTETLCTSVTTTGGQTAQKTDGANGAQMIECVAVGTVAAQAVTFKFEGSYDKSNWYTIGAYQVDGQTTLTRAISFTQTPGSGTVGNVYQLLDAYRWLRINPTANTLSGAGAGISASAYLVPM